jgi:hypothetical protein
MWTLVIIVITGNVSGNGGTRAVTSNIDFTSAATCQAAASDIGAAGTFGNGNNYMIIAKCEQR